MRKLAIALALAAIPMMAQQPYTPKGWVWLDREDSGAWHFGARDKRGHGLGGAIAASWVYMYADRNGWKHPEWWGIAAGFIIGVAKEWYDLKRSGTAERSDVIATALGGVAGVTIVRIKW